MRAILTPDDLKAGELAEVGWHPMEVIDYSEKDASEEAKNPGSTNCIWEFKILDGSSKGITLTKLINESPKSLGYNKALWSTFGFPVTANGGYDLSSDLFRKTVGFKLMGYIKRGKSNRGNEFNDLVDFKPLA
jgi:hypothetical protein